MCNWLMRRWHARKRRIDRATVWMRLRAQADERYPGDEEAAALMALRDWSMFLHRPGQEHWLCDCAEKELK